MKETNIVVERISKGRSLKKEVNREELIDYFKWLKEEFPNDCEISKKFLKVLEDIDSIYMNDDLNKTKDVPYVVIKREKDVDTIDIIRHHKIVWTKLKELASL